MTGVIATAKRLVEWWQAGDRAGTEAALRSLVAAVECHVDKQRARDARRPGRRAAAVPEPVAMDRQR